MTDQAWTAVTVGVVIVGGFVGLYTLVGLLFRIALRIYQVGEASGYRKGIDIAPLYAEGPPQSDEDVDQMIQGEWGEEGIPEPVSDQVRVNMSSGPRVASSK